MNITILLDHDLEGRVMFFEAGLRETGWDQYLSIEFKRLRDFNLPDDSTDQEIWRYVQRERLLFITNNRNRDDDTSLEAVINSENRSDSLPVLTVSAQDSWPLLDTAKVWQTSSLWLSLRSTTTLAPAESSFRSWSMRKKGAEARSNEGRRSIRKNRRVVR